MTTPFHLRHNHYPHGFTLVELILVIGFFGLISALLMNNLFKIYQVKAVIQNQKQVNSELTALLNHGVAGLIRSAFAIDYVHSKSNVLTDETEGMQEQVDELVLFTDRAETQFFKIYRQPYQIEGENSDIAQLMLQFNDSEPISLHSSQTVVESFDIILPPSPVESGDSDLQPYVQLYVRARPQKTEGEDLKNVKEDPARFSSAAYRTAFSLRNTQQSRDKTLASQ